MSSAMRHLAVPLLAAAATLTLAAAGLAAVPLTSAAAAAAPSTFGASSIAEAPDYATTVFKDPWDYSNASDLLLANSGPSMNILGASMSGGVSSFTAAPHAYISPLWTGYPHSQLLGRDGAIAANGLAASYYTRLHIHAYASRSITAALFWFTCGAQSSTCWGGKPFTMQQGWNDIDVPIVNNPKLLPSGKAWSGNIDGLRLALSPPANAKVQLDFMRVYHPAALTTWTAPRSSAASLYWSDGTSYPTSPGARQGGPVVTAPELGARQSAAVDLSGYPAGSVFYAVANRTVVGNGLHVVPRPTPVIDSPTRVGCSDYATSALGHKWTFTSTRSLASYGNANKLTFSHGTLSATNAKAHMNDPYIYLPLGRGGINGTAWNRLTITESYVGPFNLRDVAGGGTMGRIVWLSSGHTVLAQTKPLVTYSGVRTLTVDLSPTHGLTDTSGTSAQQYAFNSRSRVVKLRWDPNEDRGPRRWTVASVRLAQTCNTSTAFAMTWHDAHFTAGSTAVVSAVNTATGRATTLKTLAEHAGANTFTVRKAAAGVAGLKAGTYVLRVGVTNASRSGNTASASGPLVIK